MTTNVTKRILVIGASGSIAGSPEIGSAIGEVPRWKQTSAAGPGDELGVPSFMVGVRDAMRHTPEPVIVERLTSPPPLAFAQWAQDHASDFDTREQEAS